MIDLQGIFGKLLAFFGASPTGTRAEFEAGVVGAGIATAAEVALFADRFLAIGDDMGLIASANFDALMTKAAAVGLAKAGSGARAIYDRMLQLVDFRIADLQAKLDQVRAALVAVSAELPLIVTGRAWIAINAPGGAALKAAVLHAIDLGAADLTANKAAFERLIARYEDQIRQLGGEPT